jgi:hypothetical protein
MCTKIITDKKEREIRLELDDCECSVSAYNSDNQCIGKIEFADDGFGNHKIMRAFLDELGTEYLRCGIGTEIVKFYKDRMGCPVYASDHDGIVQEDGSHLTGDAPAWVAHLKRKKIL